MIKGFPNPHNDVAAQMARLRAIDADMPEIAFINADHAREAVVQLYHDADAAVLPRQVAAMAAADSTARGREMCIW